MPENTNRVFIVTTNGPADVVLPGMGIETVLNKLKVQRVEAAYYKSDATFTTFKDADNQQVLTIRDDHLVSVERADEAQPIVASLLDLVGRAQRSGGSGGRIVTSSETGTDGRTKTLGVHVEMTAFGEAATPEPAAAP